MEVVRLRGLFALSEEELRKVQLEELDILKYVANICEENGIDYFLDWGTLLGAVRHKGFIPWDNDIDIGMLRENYDKFCEVFPKVADENYVLQNWYTDDNWPVSYAKIRKKNTVFITNYVENCQNKELCGFDIDVFVYDDIKNDARIVYRTNMRLKFIQCLNFMKAKYRPWYRLDKFVLLKRIMYIPYQIFAFFQKREKLIREYEKIVHSFSGEKHVFCHAGTYDIQVFSKSDFCELTELEFEGVKFKCPKKFDEILSIQYGDYHQLPTQDVQEQRCFAKEICF